MKELAGDGVPVTVACRVLKLARQPYYRWLDQPMSDAMLEEAYRANALFDAHRDDPEFGYRFLADEARGAGAVMADRTAWRICRDNRWWSVFGKKRGKAKKAGPPVHDDLVRREFTADGPNRLWLADITEHATGEGKLYLCAIKDVFSKRIVGYSMDARMKSRQAVTALNNAVARRGHVDGCVLHSDRGSQGGFNRSSPDRRLDREGRGGRRQRGHGVLLQPAAEERPRPSIVGHPRGTAGGDRDLDREDLPPAPQTSLSRPADPRRIRERHDHTGSPGRVTEPVTQSCTRPECSAKLLRCSNIAFGLLRSRNPYRKPRLASTGT